MRVATLAGIIADVFTFSAPLSVRVSWRNVRRLLVAIAIACSISGTRAYGHPMQTWITVSLVKAPTHPERVVQNENVSRFQSFAKFANDLFVPPKDTLSVIDMRCAPRVGSAFFPQTKQIRMCENQLMEMYGIAINDGVSVREASEMTGSLRDFAFWHEFGHAVMDDYGIPVLGNSEWAADEFAVVLLMTNRTYERPLGQLGKLFAIMSQKGDSARAGQLLLDDHPFDSQRATNILCLLDGADPSHFLSLTGYRISSKVAISDCEYRYRYAVWAWRAVLAPYVRNHGSATELFE